MTAYGFTVQCGCPQGCAVDHGHRHDRLDLGRWHVEVIEVLVRWPDVDLALTQGEIMAAHPDLPRRKIYFLRGAGVEQLTRFSDPRSDRVLPGTTTGRQVMETGSREHVDLPCTDPSCRVVLRRKGEDLSPLLEILGEHGESHVDLRALRDRFDS